MCRRAKPVGVLWGSLLVSAGLLGCDNPHPTLTSVSPGSAYADEDVRLTLTGEGFLPAAILDPVSGPRIVVADGFSARVGTKGGPWQELTDVNWISTSQVMATLKSAAARKFSATSRDNAKPLDVELTDPRGRTTSLAGGFYELGQDKEPPSLFFTSPAEDEVFAPGSLVSGSFHAKATFPGRLVDLQWGYSEDGISQAGGTCVFPPRASESDCAFQFTLSQVPRADGRVVPDMVNREIQAWATEKSAPEETAIGATASASRSIKLAQPPIVLTISPNSGGADGGTEILIKGMGFLPGTRVTIDDLPLIPDGGIVIDEQTLMGYTPEHTTGRTTVKVSSRLGTSNIFFEYVSPPMISTVDPSTGDPKQSTPVTISGLAGSAFTPDTHIFFGLTLDGASALENPVPEYPVSGRIMVIRGSVPPDNGNSLNGRTTVWACDWALGCTKLLNGFTWSTR